MKFLISSYTGLGNFILKTPMIRAILEHFPNAQIDLICGSPWGAEKVLENSRWINQIHWCKPKSSIFKKISLFFDIRAENYDVLLCPFDSTPRFLRIFVCFLGIKKIISHLYFNKNKNLRNSLTLLFRPVITFVPILTGRHESDLNLDLLEPLLEKPTDRDLQTFVNWEHENLPFKLPESFIIIQLGACNGAPTPKTWDPKNFIEIINRWRKDHPENKFVLVGDQGDAKILESVEIPVNGVLNLLGKTTFNQLCNVLNQAELVIAHDSGVMHLANALQKPLIALYGPTDYSRTAPLFINSHMIHSRNECWAKMYNFNESESNLAKHYKDYHCMSGISCQDVLTTIKSILKNG